MRSVLAQPIVGVDARKEGNRHAALKDQALKGIMHESLAKHPIMPQQQSQPKESTRQAESKVNAKVSIIRPAKTFNIDEHRAKLLAKVQGKKPVPMALASNAIQPQSSSAQGQHSMVVSSTNRSVSGLGQQNATLRQSLAPGMPRMRKNALEMAAEEARALNGKKRDLRTVDQIMEEIKERKHLSHQQNQIQPAVKSKETKRAVMDKGSINAQSNTSSVKHKSIAANHGRSVAPNTPSKQTSSSKAYPHYESNAMDKIHENTTASRPTKQSSIQKSNPDITSMKRRHGVLDKQRIQHSDIQDMRKDMKRENKSHTLSTVAHLDRKNHTCHGYTQASSKPSAIATPIRNIKSTNSSLQPSSSNDDLASIKQQLADQAAEITRLRQQLKQQQQQESPVKLEQTKATSQSIGQSKQKSTSFSFDSSPKNSALKSGKPLHMEESPEFYRKNYSSIISEMFRRPASHQPKQSLSKRYNDSIKSGTSNKYNKYCEEEYFDDEEEEEDDDDCMESSVMDIEEEELYSERIAREEDQREAEAEAAELAAIARKRRKQR